MHGMACCQWPINVLAVSIYLRTNNYLHYICLLIIYTSCVCLKCTDLLITSIQYLTQYSAYKLE